METASPVLVAAWEREKDFDLACMHVYMCVCVCVCVCVCIKRMGKIDMEMANKRVPKKAKLDQIHIVTESQMDRN